jgi:predicted transcriptional regulator
MAEITIKISDDLKHKMEEFSMNWDSIIDAIIRNKISEWERFRSIVSKSKLTEEDALELGKKINEGLAKRYKRLLSSK